MDVSVGIFGTWCRRSRGIISAISWGFGVCGWCGWWEGCCWWGLRSSCVSCCWRVMKMTSIMSIITTSHCRLSHTPWHTPQDCQNSPSDSLPPNPHTSNNPLQNTVPVSCTSKAVSTPFSSSIFYDVWQNTHQTTISQSFTSAFRQTPYNP